MVPLLIHVQSPLTYLKDRYQDLCYSLFLLLTFPSLLFIFTTRLQADDTSLTASGRALDSLLCEINNHLPAVCEWLCSNTLTRLFKVLYFSVRSSRSRALRYGLPILHECQNYLEGGGGLGGSEKNRGTAITSLQLAFRRRDRNFAPFTIH